MAEEFIVFFENFYEVLGSFDQSTIDELKKKLFTLDLSDPSLIRPEYCFKDGGKLIVPLHYAQVRNHEYYDYVKPLVETAKQLTHPCLRGTIPFRIEVSIIEPGKNVLWHHDQHICHKYSERIHFPVITNDGVEFYGKWFLGEQIYKYRMAPGTIYRFNNRAMHRVTNPHSHFRCHVMVDFIHSNVFNHLLKTGKIETLTKMATVSPADEIYYFINQNPTGVIPVNTTTDDLEQFKMIDNLKSY